MRRRQFLTLLGGTVAAWPLTARAQQGERMRRIGFLGAGAALGWQPWIATFVQRLRDPGWSEGHTVAIEYRWGEGRRDSPRSPRSSFASRLTSSSREVAPFLC
jgi:putative tryptophan/tyrosine transport system substrate-binding protein